MERSEKQTSVIYLAGGCFWGTEHLMQSMYGVIDAESGYANGRRAEDAEYQTVKTGKTGFRETVKVTYDPQKTTLDALLFAYFRVVDPTVENRQGEDIGTQYQAGIYYIDEEAKNTVERIASIEKMRTNAFFVEIKPLENFFSAEEYHQNYLEKNPNGYCHIPFSEIRIFKNVKIDPGKYRRPSGEELENRFSTEERSLLFENKKGKAEENASSFPFKKGIFVDKVTGEPLFSSLHRVKEDSDILLFEKPIEEPVLVKFTPENGETELRSRAGNTFVGTPLYLENGEKRVNASAFSLCFVPFDEMEEKGYSYLKNLF